MEKLRSELYVSVEVLATDLGLPRAYLQRLAKAGQIPYLTVGGRKRFRPDEVLAALKKQQVTLPKQNPSSDSCEQVYRKVDQLTKNKHGKGRKKNTAHRTSPCQQ